MRVQDLTNLRPDQVNRFEVYLRDSDLMIIGFFIAVAGWALQTAGSIASNIRSSGTLLDAEAVFQLAGFILIFVGLSILAIGFFRFVRRVERHTSSHT